MECKICKNPTEKKFEVQILGKYKISYFQCQKCFFVQTESPYWLSEAYKDSINITDTGIISRNITTSEFTALIIYLYFNRNSTFLDYAGGYGIFTRLMRDIGFDFYWNDLYSQNLLARGFEFNTNKDKKIELITSFESFEHFENPLKEIELMLSISKNIFFSTVIIQEQLPSPEVWDYYGLDHGQHIALYSLKSLEYIAKKHKLCFYTNNKNLHIFSEKKLPYFNFKLLYRLRRFGFMKLIKRMIRNRVASDQLLLKQKNESSS